LWPIGYYDWVMINRIVFFFSGVCAISNYIGLTQIFKKFQLFNIVEWLDFKFKIQLSEKRCSCYDKAFSVTPVNTHNIVVLYFANILQFPISALSESWFRKRQRRDEKIICVARAGRQLQSRGEMQPSASVLGARDWNSSFPHNILDTYIGILYIIIMYSGWIIGLFT